MVEDVDPDWKLKLRYGQMKTEFQPFSLIAEGRVVTPSADYETSLGPAFMGMKAWALDDEQAFDMIAVIGKQVGFEVTGRIQLYETDPKEPPKSDTPFGYNIKFTPFDDGA